MFILESAGTLTRSASITYEWGFFKFMELQWAIQLDKVKFFLKGGTHESQK